MRKLWSESFWEEYLIEKEHRSGIRVRFDKTVDNEVRRACKEFIRWLRRDYFFPIRVPIYIKSSKTVKSRSGENVSALFFGPFDKEAEPYISVAVGDYYDMVNKWGKDNALAAILCSISHELSHYFQWITDCKLPNAALERQALYYAHAILDDYDLEREHP